MLSNLYSLTGNRKARIEGLSFSKISEREASNLELPFFEEEVFSALYDMDGDSPKVGWFHSAFW